MVWAAGNHIQQRYVLKKRLRDRPGRQVWLAQDLITQDQVVLKCLSFEGQLAWDDVKLFEREIHTLQRINHPQIPQYLNSFRIEQPIFQICLVEAYIHGPSLQAFLDRGQRLSPAQIWTIAAQLLSILQYLHGLKPPILHRDIKPSNILVTAEKSVHLIDFGSVQTQLKGKTRDTPTLVGTYGYTPLEQFAGNPVPSTDLFGVGATLIHLLTHQNPAALMDKNLRIHLPSNLQVHSQQLQWLSKMIAPTAGNRFQSATQALQTLHQVQVAPKILRLANTLNIGTSQSRLNIQKSPQQLIIEIQEYWNPETIAISDLIGLLSLSYLPLLLGGLASITLFARNIALDAGTLGIEELLLLSSIIPAFLGSSTLIKNLGQSQICCTPGELRVTSRIKTVRIRQWQWQWERVQQFQTQMLHPNQPNVLVELSEAQSITLAYRLSPQEAETLIQTIEQWRIGYQQV